MSGLMLGIDSSAVSGACAVCFQGDHFDILGEQFINTKHTHSQTLLPMVESVMKCTEVRPCDLEGGIAVTVGPGSFTGLRIGIATAKGIAVGHDLPCIAVSSLEALAYNFVGNEAVVCCAMNARGGQIFNALFDVNGYKVTRLCEDRIIKIAEFNEQGMSPVGELYDELAAFTGKVILAGDDAPMLHTLTDGRYELAPKHLRFILGSSVCRAAVDKPFTDPAALMPTYLRLPQAERERLAREQGAK